MSAIQIIIKPLVCVFMNAVAHMTHNKLFRNMEREPFEESAEEDIEGVEDVKDPELDEWSDEEDEDLNLISELKEDLVEDDQL